MATKPGFSTRVKSLSLRTNSEVKQPGTLEVNPPEIVFKDIVINQMYEITVEVRNLGRRAVRIRLQKPTNPCFELEYTLQQEIAPGLAVLAKIKYESKTLKNQNQKILIMTSQGTKMDLPIRVYTMQSHLLFEPFVNMGFIKVGNVKSETVVFKNEGKAAGTVHFSHNHAPLLTVDPMSLTIQPDKVQYLNVKFKSEEAGLFKGEILLESDSVLLKKSIDITATTVEFSRFFVDSDGQQQTLFDFGDMYVGEFNQITMSLINNSPKPISFKTSIRSGLKISQEQFNLVQSPSELGHQQNQRILFCQPDHGEVKSFSSAKIKLITKSRMTYKDQVFVRNYALTPLGEEIVYPQSRKEDSGFSPSNTHEYSVLFEFDDNQPLVIQTKGNIHCPLIKLQRNLFQFGDCPSFQSRNIGFVVQNVIPSRKVTLSFPKIPNFSINPNRQKLLDKQQVELIATFQPKNIGKFDTSQALLVNDIYEIPLRFFGVSSTAGKKGPKNGATSRSYYVNDLQIDQSRKKAFSLTAQKSFINKIKTLNMPDDKLLELSLHLENKQRFDSVLKQGRETRIESQKQRKVEQKWNAYTSKLKQLGIDKKYEEQFDSEGVPNAPPIDYQFESGMIDTKLDPQRIPLPQSNQRLYVTKHIGSYAPPDKKKSKQKYEPNEDQAAKKVRPSKPQNHKQQRDIQSDLAFAQLEQIQVGPLTIHFGDLFVKCPASKFFWVKNSTRKSIVVRLQSSKPQLSKSNFVAQIIPSCSQASFQVVMCREATGGITSNMKYIINEKYTFQMALLGKVVPVGLELSENQMKFNFEENNLEMSTSRRLVLTNNGNGKAHFKFVCGRQRLFVPSVMEGVIQSKAVLPVDIVFNAPFVTTIKNEYSYSQRLLIKILDGVQMSVHCAAFVPEPKLYIAPSTIDYGTLCIGKEIIRSLTFNNTSKFHSVVHVDTDGYKGVKCCGKILIPSETSRELEVRFKAGVEGEVLSKINIKTRGSKHRVVECRAKVVKPSLLFEKVIDFDHMIVMGHPGLKKFTLTNASEVEVPLIIDLEHPNQFVQCIELKLLSKQAYLQPYRERAPSANSEEPRNLLQNLSPGDNIPSQAQQKQEQDSTEQTVRKYILVLRPKGHYQFQVKFKAKQSVEYRFNIPFSIKNYGPIDSPLITAVGIQPKFIFDPQVVDFQKKVITTPEKCYPRYIDVTISNPDVQPVTWELNTTQFNKQQVFTISQRQGKLQPGEKIVLKVSFNPFEVGDYKHSVPLFIESKSMKKSKYLDVEIKGTASYPRLQFSKREVILPVVPLNVLAETSFNVINDGYQNTNFKYQVVDDIANLNLKLSFPQGHTLGLTRNKFRCQVGFVYYKPMSFSIKIQFVDDYDRSFFITVSGSTDNCLFTNYGFFLRNAGRFKIVTGDSLKVVEGQDELRVRKKSVMSMKSSATSKSHSLVSYLGSNMIKSGILEYTIEYLTRYLNSNVLTIKIESFPQSLIDSDGLQLFEIINFYTTKGSSFPCRCTIKEKGLVKVKALYNQYSQLIKMLKMEGAQLNHIRPQYLLSLNDLNLYLQEALTAEQKACFGPNLTRVNTSLFNYLSMDSWIGLLYQVFRIYFLFRLTPKSYRTHLANSEDAKSALDVPKGYLQGSNFLSPSEGIIIHWIETAASQVLLEQRRITSFQKDFKDGILIAVLLKKYANSFVLKSLKQPCVSDQDYKQNAQKVVQALEQIGLSSHLVPKDIYNPLQRQMLLFLVHLYHYLPYYIPQSAPIQFTCVLGDEVTRGIELTNPSTKAVNYMVRYEGSEDFIPLGEKQFRIEPKKTHTYQVKFVSRVSAQVTGRISFVNRKQNSIIAAAVVFNFRSNITGKISDKIWNITGVLYQQIDFPIDIVNKFQSAETPQFNITIVTEYLYQKKQRGRQPTKQIPKQLELQTVFCKCDVIRLRKNVPTQIQLSFIPTSLHTTRSTIMFSNLLVGQFQHEILALVEPPPVIADVKPPMVLSVDQVVNWEYTLFFKNQNLVKAKRLIEGFKKLPANNKKPTPKDSFVGKKVSDEPSVVVLSVDIAPNPYISSKSQIVLTDKKDTSKIKESQREVVQLDNKLPLSYTCKNPVLDYFVVATLTNAEKTDVRRYRLYMTVQPKPLKAILEMSCPARGQLTQNLPIVNNTQKDWIIKVQWIPDLSKNGHYFSMPEQFKKDFPVKKQSVGNLPLTFRPRWVQKAGARLVLSNPITMDQFEYQIRGIGEEPLQEEHVEIKCEVKETVRRQLMVKNPYNDKPITFCVQTDLSNCTVPQKVAISPGGKQKLVLQVHPVLCGEYTGSITLLEQNGEQYLWYTVTVVTGQPKSSGTIDLKSEVRKLATQRIQIPNKTQKDHLYNVIILGNDLYGQSTVLANHSNTSYYQINFLPLKQGQQRGTVCLINEQQGEILYDIKTKADQPATQYIKVKCSLGSVQEHTVKLQNPSDSVASLNVFNSNTDCFDTQYKSFKLQPHQQLQVKILYTASTMDTTQRADIKFSSSQIGNWRFLLQGTGTPPVPSPAETIHNTLNTQKTNIILFRNPFNYPITMGVSIDFPTDQSESVFKLLLKNKVQTVQPKQFLQIPYEFAPVACRRYSCRITASINSSLRWEFPVVGIAQVVQGKILSFKTKCRQKQSELVSLQLKGAVNYGPAYQYLYKLESIPKQVQKLVQKFFTVNQNSKSLSSEGDRLEFQFFYKPLKPSSFSFDFVVQEKTGPRWRYKIILEALQPDVDDVIDIQSPLLVTTSLAFKLTNRVKSDTQFTAKFTSDSANEFSIEPKQGLLPPYGHQGKKFIVSFTPIEYGKQKTGKLKIQTQDMYWSYALKGNLPKYTPPKFPESSLNVGTSSRAPSLSGKPRSMSKQ